MYNYAGCEKAIKECKKALIRNIYSLLILYVLMIIAACVASSL